MKDIDDTKAPLLEHLIELRRRLLLVARRCSSCSSSVCLYFAKTIFAFLVQPLLAAGQGKLIYTDIFEAFFVEVKVALFAALMLGFPVLRDPDVEVRRARALREGEEGASAVPAADARLLRRAARPSLISSRCPGRCISC